MAERRRAAATPKGWPKRGRRVNHWCRYVLARQFADPAGWELQNMLCVARLMIDAALARQESRGAHVRIDFPGLDETHWSRHICFRQ